jgi:hypothetical protein
MVSLPSCFYETSLHSLVLRKLHAVAITSFYVALRAAARLGLQLLEWVREAAATEEFEWRGRSRKIVPDAFVVVADKDCECRAFVEIDWVDEHDPVHRPASPGTRQEVVGRQGLEACPPD